MLAASLLPKPADTRRFQGDLRAVCGAFHVHPAANPAGSVRTSRFGGFDLVHVATNARAIERNDRDVRRDHDPHYFLIRQVKGHARMQQRDRLVDLSMGDFFLASSTRPALFRYEASSVQASLHLPRAQLTETLGQTSAAGLHLSASSVMGRAVTRALMRLSRQQTSELADLLAIAAQNLSPTELELTAAAQELIARRATDPALTPAVLADLLGVSLRQLQRALATEGLTPSAAIARHRMTAVHILLRTRPDLTITACATQAGFPDISRFTRDFRTWAGCTPGQYRRNSN